MLAHIRYATQGDVSLENVHPFSRVWMGVQMTFCHNGDCPHFGRRSTTSLPLLGQTTANDVIYHPIGETDSEAVFCAILNALNVEFPNSLPTLPVLHESLSDLCHEITSKHPESTIFNFLLGCGQHTLFAYSWPGKRPGSDVWNGLHYIVRKPPFSTAKLLDADCEIDFSLVTTPDDRVAVVTTKPLTEECGWIEFKRNELIMFNHGMPYRTPKCCEEAEAAGCGLSSKLVTTKCNTRSPQLYSNKMPASHTSLNTMDKTITTLDDKGLEQFSLNDYIPSSSPQQQPHCAEKNCTTTESSYIRQSTILPTFDIDELYRTTSIFNSSGREWTYRQ
jgi:predicted glutamine amidotransferase